jgi:hypothetical protein
VKANPYPDTQTKILAPPFPVLNSLIGALDYEGPAFRADETFITSATAERPSSRYGRFASQSLRDHGRVK